VRKLIEEIHPVNELLDSDTVTLEKADPEIPLWTSRRESERLRLNQLHAIPKEASERADVSADITLTNIRQSRVFLLATESGLMIGTLRRLLG